MRDGGGNQKAGADRYCRHAYQQERVARDVVGLETTNDDERDTKQDEYDAELNSIQNAVERSFDIAVQSFKVTAAGFAFEKGDEILVASEAVEQARVNFGEMPARPAATDVHRDHPDNPAEDAGTTRNDDGYRGVFRHSISRASIFRQPFNVVDRDPGQWYFALLQLQAELLYNGIEYRETALGIDLAFSRPL